MAQSVKFIIEHPTGEVESHEIESIENGDIVEFTYTSEAEGGPVFSPRHMPAGG